MSIPVFHDDQHGTAIITGAALTNALELVEKDVAGIQVVFTGAGAAALATAEHYVRLGVPRDHITLCDEHGPLHEGRTDLNPYQRRFARSLRGAVAGRAVPRRRRVRRALRRRHRHTAT